jgi:hypothetical protein
MEPKSFLLKIIDGLSSIRGGRRPLVTSFLNESPPHYGLDEIRDADESEGCNLSHSRVDEIRTPALSAPHFGWMK